MTEVSKIVPTLETERLILRGIEQRDFEPFAAFYASDGSRFVGGPMDDTAAWRKLAGYAGGWLLRGFGQFAVEEKASGKFAGVVGPYFPVGWPEPEIAWTILPDFQGNGYATEAAKRSLRFAYETLGWKTAISSMDEGNKQSVGVAGRLGATFEGMAEVRPFGQLRVYRHIPPEEFLAEANGRDAA